MPWLLHAGHQPLASVALSRMNFESFVRELLLVRQYRVEVYRSKAKAVWTLAFKACSILPWPDSLPCSLSQASPGNLQQLEDIVFADGAISHTPLSLAVRLGHTAGSRGARLVGVACVDTSHHVLKVAEFTDNDQLSELQVC